jgi:hypothetical protein
VAQDRAGAHQSPFFVMLSPPNVSTKKCPLGSSEN